MYCLLYNVCTTRKTVHRIRRARKVCYVLLQKIKVSEKWEFGTKEYWSVNWSIERKLLKWCSAIVICSNQCFIELDFFMLLIVWTTREHLHIIFP